MRRRAPSLRFYLLRKFTLSLQCNGFVTPPPPPTSPRKQIVHACNYIVNTVAILINFSNNIAFFSNMYVTLLTNNNVE